MDFSRVVVVEDLEAAWADKTGSSTAFAKLL